MRALASDRQRAFVIACTQPTPEGEVNYTQAAADAGYGGSRATLAVTSHRLAHDERVQAAMLEEGQRRMGAGIPLAVASIIQIMTTATKNGERLKAAGMLLNRAGMPEKSEHEIKVTRTESMGEKVERAIRLAKEMGIDPEALLGKYGITMPTANSSVLEKPLTLEDFLH